MSAVDASCLEARDLPPCLAGLTPPCVRLFIQGTLPRGAPRIAIVGSRAPSASGAHAAYEIAWGLGRAGVVVVSGLARGIDSAAHRGALDAGGQTVAFLGSGFDQLSPRSARELGTRIRGQGALVSEYPPAMAALPYRFVHRNRLIASYSQGTLVVEGGAKSGALITAGMALERGREVWVVPGDSRRPSCRGSNRLLRDGAAAVLEADDLLAALGLLGAAGTGEETPIEPPGLSRPERDVWRALAERGPADPETLSRRSGLTTSALLQALSLLELAGRVRRDGSGYALAPGDPEGWDNGYSEKRLTGFDTDSPRGYASGRVGAADSSGSRGPSIPALDRLSPGAPVISSVETRSYASSPLMLRRLQQSGLGDIAGRVASGERLDREDGLALYAASDVAAVGLLANQVRERLHGDRTWFVRNRHLNPTNVCEADCLFCAYKADPGDPRGWTLAKAQIQDRIRRMVDEDIREVHIVGGHNPEIGYRYFVDTLRWVKEVSPHIHVKAYTMAEIVFFSQVSGKSIEDVVTDLKEAGLDACTGGGAEILGERVRRKIVRGKVDGQGWLDTARRVHRMGVKSNCTMLYGHIETDADRVDHLLALRELQDETDGFQAFIPLAFHNANNRLRKLNAPTGVDDLKNLAVSRLLLDNVPHIKAYWPMHTPALAQIALGMGVDDIDGTVVEEHIYHMAGADTDQAMSVDELVALIRSAGRIPLERDALYHTVREY